MPSMNGKECWSGNADWCDDDTVESLKLEEGICREFADSALVEMEAKILNNDKMDKVLQKGLSDINKKLQDRSCSWSNSVQTAWSGQS